jgi:hypothetical protein
MALDIEALRAKEANEVHDDADSFTDASWLELREMTLMFMYAVVDEATVNCRNAELAADAYDVCPVMLNRSTVTQVVLWFDVTDVPTVSVDADPPAVDAI